MPSDRAVGARTAIASAFMRVLLGAPFQPLLDRFVSDYEPEPLRGVPVGCALHVEVRERYPVRHGLGSTFFNGDEMKLIVHPPVVRHAVGRTVVEHQLWMTGRCAADKHVVRR